MTVSGNFLRLQLYTGSLESDSGWFIAKTHFLWPIAQLTGPIATHWMTVSAGACVREFTGNAPFILSFLSVFGFFSAF